MQANEYQKLAAYEDWYWWYRAERRILVDTIRGLNLHPGSRLLDAGCGSGRNLLELHREFDITGYGVDNSVHAAALWNGHRRADRCLGSVNALPYADGSFDALISVDVLQCRQIQPQTSMKEMARVVARGGYLVVLAPAYQWLLSRHDQAVHAAQRFCRADLRLMAHRADLTVTRLTHLFPVFFPCIAAVRLIHKLRLNDGTTASSDLSRLPRWLNGVLYAVARLEQVIVRRVGAPFGSTVLLVARKDQA